ncbi:MAG: putative rane protein [Verrucomicrobiales bacterium]|nr:putative rane protein [Verrucomicrobiales bacterium]
MKAILELLKQTFKEWNEDKAPRLGAAMAYYTIFSIAPILIISITIAGKLMDNAQGQILDQVQGMLGDKGREAVESMVEAANKPVQSAVATITAFATLLFGAAGVFIQLKDALNTIWKVKETTASGIMAYIKKYFLSFSMVLGLGFLLLVSLVMSAGLAMVGSYLNGWFKGMEVVMNLISFGVSFGLISVLFALLFKFLPDQRVAWKDVGIGAVLTSFCFVVGKFALGFYLGKASTVSAYGAAGSLVVMLLWVYYSAQILFFGAEFTQVYAKRHGSHYQAAPIPKNKKQQLIFESDLHRREINLEVKKFKRL